MTILETALVVLVVIWSIIFIIIAVALVYLLKEFKTALDKVHIILERGERAAKEVETTARMTSLGVAGILAKSGTSKLKQITQRVLSRKRLTLQ